METTKWKCLAGGHVYSELLCPAVFPLQGGKVWVEPQFCLNSEDTLQAEAYTHTHTRTHLHTQTHTHTLLMPGGILLLQHCPETHEQVAFNVWAQERAGEPCRGEKEKDKCKQKATGTMFSNTAALKQCTFFACLTPLTNYLLETYLNVLIKRCY